MTVTGYMPAKYRYANRVQMLHVKHQGGSSSRAGPFGSLSGSLSRLVVISSLIKIELRTAGVLRTTMIEYNRLETALVAI